VLFIEDYILFAGEKEVDRTGRKKLFDATELEDVDRDDSTKSNNEVTSAGNGNNSDFIRMLTSLLDSMVSAIFTHSLHF
jgi:hypothetical protein